MKNPFGIYIHVPFCTAKCPYCSFYSKLPRKEIMQSYKTQVKNRLTLWGEKIKNSADTLYFGGGTPSILGSDGLCEIAEEVFKNFLFSSKNREVTTEMNPELPNNFDFYKLKYSGFNRLSIGLQSSNEEELRMLGRRHTADMVKFVISKATNAGIENVSLDIMLGVQGQTLESLKQTLDFCLECNVKHISAYMLKVEPKTVYYNKIDSLELPSEDEVCEMYLYCCEYLEKNGFGQYEISNFAIPGFESRHNLKYWNCDDYLGIGPSAHSFIEGVRFYSKSNMSEFLRGEGETLYEGNGKISLKEQTEEYIMLRLRLNDGISKLNFKTKFGIELPSNYFKRAKELKNTGLLNFTEDKISLTRQGFLLSNQVIAEILFGV